MEKTILVVENAPNRADGISYFLTQLSTEYEIARPFAGSALPPLDHCSAIIVSGGPMSVYDWMKTEFEFLRAEADYLVKAMQADTPILGICLGHQLLAQALGGKVEPSKYPEYGWYEVSCNLDENTILANLGGRFCTFQYHGDEVSQLPKDAIPLAESPACHYEAFKLDKNRVWGVQFHPEIVPDAARRILYASKERLAQTGIDADAMISKGYRSFGGQSLALFKNFVAIVNASYNS